jgi:resuscitation-promoting factor RpfB
MKKYTYSFIAWLKLHGIVPLVTVGVLSVGSVGLWLAYGGSVKGSDDVRQVRVSYDGKNKLVPTRAESVGDLLKNMNIVLTPEDVVEPAKDAPINKDNFSVNIYRARPVTIVDTNGDTLVKKIAEQEPKAVVKRAGISVYPEDVVVTRSQSLPLDNGVLGDRIEIDRAVPVKLSLYGATYDIRTQAKTVADLMKERHLDHSAGSVLPALTAPLTTNMAVFVTEPGRTITTSEESVEQPTEFVESVDLDIGKKETREEGAPGKKVVVYDVANDGSKRKIQEIIVLQPTKKVVAKGAKRSSPTQSVAADRAAIMSAAGIASSQQSSADYIIARESGWRPGARNASGCIGLGQKCNAASLARACPNWETDPVCQMQHFNGYAVGRYGSWEKAYAFWTVNHWW